jgi:hypothetical protein
MSYADWILAAALLTNPQPLEAQLQDPGALQEHFQVLRWPMLALALEWELLDPRETRYVLADAKDFATDTTMLRKRQHDLVDAPRLADAWRFPDRAAVNELLVFNRAYRKYLEERQPVDPLHATELRYVIREVDYLFTIWDAVRDARCDYYFVHVRRQALKRLREMLPEDDYYGGQLPPHVPFWRFQTVP